MRLEKLLCQTTFLHEFGRAFPRSVPSFVESQIGRLCWQVLINDAECKQNATYCFACGFWYPAEQWELTSRHFESTTNHDMRESITNHYELLSKIMVLLCSLYFPTNGWHSWFSKCGCCDGIEKHTFQNNALVKKKLQRISSMSEWSSKIPEVKSDT